MNPEELRKRLEAIDARILDLLNERAKCALELGDADRDKGLPDALREHNPGPLSNDGVKAIYREILSATRAVTKPVEAAFLGPLYTFSHLAALKVFGAQAVYHPVATIDDVFTEVERKRVDFGVVPVETSMGGGVSDTLDRFVTSDLKITHEMLLHIRQNLLSNGPLEDVNKVYSKAQSFVQCRSWLKANLPNAELVETASTAEAARIAAQQPGAAAIAGALAAEHYSVRSLVEGIEDAPHNFTRFFVIGRQMAERTGNDKTSVVCAIKDRPGALYDLLTPFAKSDVNLTRIESRPSQRKAWEYVFFIDMLGHADDEAVKQALEGVAKHCNELKVLGSFPCGELEE